jgi:hypothetical protein
MTSGRRRLAADTNAAPSDNLALYGNKPAIVLSSRPLGFLLSQRRDCRADIWGTDRNRKAAQSTRLQTCVCGRWCHDSAIPRSRMYRPVGDHARAGTHWSRYSAIWPSAARRPASHVATHSYTGGLVQSEYEVGEEGPS